MRRCPTALEMGQRLSVAGVLQVVLEARVDLGVVCGGPLVDGFRDADEGGEVVSSGLARAEHVLEAHRTLSAANEDNARKFAGVVDLLSQEAKRHEAAP